MPIFYLSNTDIDFPPPGFADETGLLAVGGDLSTGRLLKAYEMGIFPWFSEGEPYLWWSPDPRLVLFPHELKVSKSLKKLLRKNKFKVTFDLAFGDVIRNCAQVRHEKSEETWIVDEMVEAYERLHHEGYAHSVEAWLDDELAGGLYGVSLGKCFFGESMFARVSNASKIAFAHMVKRLEYLDFTMIDCQVTTAHLVSMGAREIPRQAFLEHLNKSLTHPTMRGPWPFNSNDNINR